MVGAVLLGIQFLAGHIEISIYNLMVIGLYAAWRTFSHAPALAVAGKAAAIGLVAAMIGIGIALGAVQLVPLYEVASQNFRVGSVSYETVISYAYPARQLIAFAMPDFFGNPTHHSYFDVFDFAFHAAPSGTIFWGSKNYVEAGAYVGILPLLLALVAVGASVASVVRSARKQATDEGQGLSRAVIFFALLAIVSLLFTFGTPLYALLFFGVPGFNQLHTPFRWIYPYTLSIAALAGIGAQVLASGITRDATIQVR